MKLKLATKSSRLQKFGANIAEGIAMLFILFNVQRCNSGGNAGLRLFSSIRRYFFHFIFFHFIKEGSPSTRVVYKWPSTKNITIQLHNEKEKLQYKNPILKA